jgi:hypothetical protein
MNKKVFLLFIVVISVAFWQVLFLQNSLKWDFIDAFLPSRYFFSESILNYQVPLWNPYILYGIPLFGDLVSVFNPEFWIVSNLFGYSNITLQLLYLVYILFAGFSFYHFINSLNHDKRISIGLAIAYMLSGVVVGNAQNLAVISGYALLPFVIKTYLSFLNDISFKKCIEFSLSFILMIFMSYPALTLILIYVLLPFFIYFLFKSKKYKKTIFYHLIILAIVLLASTVLVISFFQVSPFLGQYGGISLDIAQQHPFSPKSFISLIFPMATGIKSDIWMTDISMANGYFGIISIILLLVTLFSSNKSGLSIIFLAIAIFSTLTSLGDYFFLREFLYDYFPFLDLFRYPSLFRVFTIFSLLTFIGINYTFNRKKLIYASSFILILVFCIAFYSFRKTTEIPYFSESFNFKEALFSVNIYDNIVFQSIFHIFILVFLILSLFFVKKEKAVKWIVILLFIVDGIISVQLNINYTVISNTCPIELKSYLNKLPKGFPTPDLTPIKEYSDKNNSNEFIWINGNVFPKQPSFDGMISFQLDGYRKLETEKPELLNLIKENPLLYLTDEIYKNGVLSKKSILVNQSQKEKIEENKLKLNSTDIIEITSFSPKEIKVSTNTSDQTVLVLQQNYFDGWRAYIDGEEQEIIVANYTHISVKLEPGEHEVIFKYENPLIIIALIFSYIIILSLITIVSLPYLKNKKTNKFIVLTIISISITLIITNRLSYKKAKQGILPEIKEDINRWKKEYQDLNVIISSNEPNQINNIYFDTIIDFNKLSNQSIFSDLLYKNKKEYIALIWQNTLLTEDIINLFKSFYPETIDYKTNLNSGFFIAKKSNSSKNTPFIQAFENIDSFWSSNPERVIYDSIKSSNIFCFEPNNEWGPAFIHQYTKEEIINKKIVFYLDFKLSELSKKALFTYTIERNGEIILWESKPINPFAYSIEKWTRGAFTFSLDQYKDGDTIKAYLWNKEKTEFSIDNLDVILTDKVNE